MRSVYGRVSTSVYALMTIQRARRAAAAAPFTRESLFVHLRFLEARAQTSLGLVIRSRSPTCGLPLGADRYTLDRGLCTSTHMRTFVSELMSAHKVFRSLLFVEVFLT